MRKKKCKVTLLMVSMVLAGFCAQNSYAEGVNTQRIYNITRATDSSAIKGETDGQWKIETQTEEVLSVHEPVHWDAASGKPVNRASASNAVQEEDSSQFTSFEPQESDIPDWYTRTYTAHSQPLYVFTDRYGKNQYRVFGASGDSAGKGSLPMTGEEGALRWYECDAEGVPRKNKPIDTQQEDLELAPFRYVSTEVEDADLKQLSLMLYGNENEITNKNMEIEDPYMGVNYDGTWYDVWSISDNVGYDSTIYYYMYGHKVNVKGESRDKWYQCNDQGQILEDTAQNTLTKEYYNDPSTAVNYSNNAVLVNGVRSWGNYPQIYNYTDAWEYYGKLTGICAYNSDGNNVGVNTYPALGGKGYGTVQYKNYVKNGWAMVDIKSTEYRHDLYDWTPNYLTTTVNLKCGQLLILKFSDGGSWPFMGYINTNKGAQLYNGKLCTNADRGYRNNNLTHFLIPATTDISGNWLVYVYGSEHNKNDADKDYYIYSPIHHTITVNVNHNYVNGVCTGCGYTPHTHDYNTYVKTVKEPNCTDTGTAQYSCSCKGVKNITVPALGHVFEEDFYTDADDGTYYKRCTRDGCDEKDALSYNPYTITYHGNGHTVGTMESSSHIYGTRKRLNQNQFRKRHYSFREWAMGAVGGATYSDRQEVDKLTPVYGGSVDLYAQWTPNHYQITYNHNHERWTAGDTVESYPFGSPIGEMPEPSMDGYTFEGWYRTNACEGGPVTENDMVEPENVVYYAKWRANTYTIYFDYNHYSIQEHPKSIQCVYGTKLGELPALEASAAGYTFKGWYTQAEGGEAADSESPVPLGDTTYYAHWEAKPYSLELATDKAKLLGDGCIPVIFDSAIGEMPEPVLEDFQFLGWYQEEYSQNRKEGILGDTESPSSNSLLSAETLWKIDRDTRAYAYFSLVYKDSGDNTNRRPGLDRILDTADDNYYFNGLDKTPGTSDDQKIYPGLDRGYGTEDDYYIRDDNTHLRPGTDGTFGTEDDEIWWNGPDGQPGTEDDQRIYPGMDGGYGTEDDYIIRDENTVIHPGTDGMFGTGDDGIWWNGPDGIPGTGDDRLIYPGDNGKYGTKDDYYINDNGNKVYPGPDLIFGTEDDIEDVPLTGGSSSSSSGGSGGGSSNRVVDAETSNVPDTGGQFRGVGDEWIYIKPDGSQARNEWVGDGKDWYHINGTGFMDFGWFQEDGNKWYILNREHDGFFGAAKKDWYYENQDSQWYYLNPATQEMLTGWRIINGKWYYFETHPSEQTYYGDNKNGWYYDKKKAGSKPYGSMYRDEVTPDGYRVDASGAWSSE